MARAVGGGRARAGAGRRAGGGRRRDLRGREWRFSPEGRDGIAIRRPDNDQNAQKLRARPELSSKVVARAAKPLKSAGRAHALLSGMVVAEGLPALAINWW